MLINGIILHVLCSLDWLPVGYRVDFKILLLVYKTLNNMAPSYLTSPNQITQVIKSETLVDSQVMVEVYGCLLIFCSFPSDFGMICSFWLDWLHLFLFLNLSKKLYCLMIFHSTVIFFHSTVIFLICWSTFFYGNLL